MSQETEIKIRIDDNEAIHQLRGMLDIVEKIENGLGGLQMPAGGGGGGGGAPSSSLGKSRSERQAAEFWRTFRREQQEEDNKKQRALGVPERLTSPFSGGFTAGGFGQTIGTSLREAASSVPYAGVPVAAMGAYFGLVGRSLEERQNQLSKVAELEGLETGLMGSVDGFTPDFVKTQATNLNSLGFNQLQTAELVTQVASSVGLKTLAGEVSGGRLKELAAAQKAGIPAEVLAATAGAIAQATGKSVGSALDESLNLKNLAEQGLDLRGQGVTAFLSSFTSMIDKFTSEGVKVDSKSLAREITGVARATGARGERAGQITSSLIDVAGGAGGDVRSSLQGFAQNLLTAEAASKSTDLFSFLQQTEKLQASPTRVAQEIAKGAGGGRDAAAVLASLQGIGTGDAVGLLGARRGQGEFGARVSVADVEDRLTISEAFAKSADSALNVVSADKDQGAQLIQISSDMQTALLKVSENEKVVTTLAQGLTSTIDIIVDTQSGIQKALDWMRRNL